MANYANLKAAINANIKTNDNEEITGAILNAQLIAMVNSLGAGYQFVGIATPSTDPGTPDQNVYYIASQAGTYTNFGGLVLNDGEVAVLMYNGSWSKAVTGAATAEQVNQLGAEVDGFDHELNGYSDTVQNIIPYVANTSITHNATRIDVAIQSGETFYLRLNVTTGIAADKSFGIEANGAGISNVTDADADRLMVGTTKKYIATEDISYVSCYLQRSNITANGTLTFIVEKRERGVIPSYDLLLSSPMNCASSDVTVTDDRPTSVVYKDEDGNVIRTDTIVYSDTSITETRVLSSGLTLTITTNLETLNQTMTWN